MATDYTNNLILYYDYDGQNNRVWKGVQQVNALNYASSYLYDITGPLPEIVGEYPNNASATWYVPGAKALAMDTNGALDYFAYDGLGTARALYDSTGAQRDLTNYDPYGQVIA